MMLRDKIAAVQHEIWSHWMKYLFSVCKSYPGGSLLIPPDKVVWWRRLMNTKYADLTPNEQRSDLEQADKVIKVLGADDWEEGARLWSK